jgi:cytochrome c oxidase subunit I+III
VFWPGVSVLLMLCAWGLTVGARRWNARDQARNYYVGLASAALLAMGGGAALVAGPWTTGLNPQSGVYPATVWVLVAWTAFHVAVGVLMQIYCLARRWAGRMTARHDIDIRNVALYWHFLGLTVVLTVGVIAGFPLVK